MAEISVWLWVVIGGGVLGVGGVALVWGLCRAAAASESLDGLTAENDGEYLG